METMKCCRQDIASKYEEIPRDEMSDDAAMQLIADVVFLEIALGGKEDGEFSNVRKGLLEKVGVFIKFG
jgi:hypothetical protein